MFMSSVSHRPKVSTGQSIRPHCCWGCRRFTHRVYCPVTDAVPPLAPENIFISVNRPQELCYVWENMESSLNRNVGIRSVLILHVFMHYAVVSRRFQPPAQYAFSLAPRALVYSSVASYVREYRPYIFCMYKRTKFASYAPFHMSYPGSIYIYSPFVSILCCARWCILR